MTANARNLTCFELLDFMHSYGVDKAPYNDWLHITDKKDNNESSNQDIMSLKLDELDLSVRTYNTLLRRNILTFQDIVALSPDELGKLNGLSKRGYSEVMQLLTKYGINTDKY
jgi:DNA-directed RNA polymerase alpha subunit